MAAIRLEFHPDAVEEARAARLRYAARSARAADAFVQEIDTAVHKIQEAPQRWPEYLHGTRHYLLRRFPFSIVYRVSGEMIQVLAVAHGKRRPGYWRAR
ncbi:MAG: type II toxin-antitoxin system RelE/ParE family toxin [Planctomycetes bacterium]|nr:type II toxin-antitoxin system RelE/ParE family toxin [Planctomycetota bacterium]